MCCVCLAVAAPFVLHCLSEKKKQPTSDDNNRMAYQPYKHLHSSAETNGGDGPASVEMSSLLDDRGITGMLSLRFVLFASRLITLLVLVFT